MAAPVEVLVEVMAMREILFRGKQSDNGKWVEGCLDHNPLTKLTFIRKPKHIYTDVVMVLPETIGQYTGLKDKNGKKIFEGDVMPLWDSGERYLYKVIYNSDCFMLAMLDSEQGSYPLSTKHKMSEVIGNIHDAPELNKPKEVSE